MKVKPLPDGLGCAVALCIVLMSLLAACSARAEAQITSGKRVRVVSPREQALHVLLLKAKAEADARNYSAAQADYEKYLAQQPDDAAAHFDLGYVYTAQRQTDKAIAEYRKAVALDPKMMAAHLNLGMSLLVESPKEAIAPLEKVVQMDYALERGHFALAIAEERSGNAPAAEEQYTIAVKLDPNDAEGHAGLGRILLLENKAAKAEEEFREALYLKAGDAESELGLAQSLIAQKKTADAAQTLHDYLKANPNDARARVIEASLLFRLGENKEALAALEKAGQDGEALDALKLRAQIYYAEKSYPNELAALEKAEKLAPKDATIHAQIGHALLQMQNYPEAAQELTESLQLGASSTDTLRDLVAAKYLGKNYPGALAALNLLAKRVPPNAGAWYLRGSCYDHLNQPKAALDAYEKFLAMNTNLNSDQYFEAAARARYLRKLIQQKGK